MEIIQLNKFSELHNGENIIFCKTDFILQEFENIKKIKNEVILITGNSDYPIDQSRSKLIPDNVKKWYGQNILVKHEKIEPIPLGIENSKKSIREGHGVGYDYAVKKENLLYRKTEKVPNKLIYSNFNINTNFSHRNFVKQTSIKSPHIEWEEPCLNLEQFFDKILDYEMIVCPMGNGVDTHRLWEVLYSNRIPITIKNGDYKIYELYKKLPIIILDRVDELLDLDLILHKKNKLSESNYELKYLDFNYWKNEIKKL